MCFMETCLNPLMSCCLPECLFFYIACYCCMYWKALREFWWRQAMRLFNKIQYKYFICIKHAKCFLPKNVLYVYMYFTVNKSTKKLWYLPYKKPLTSQSTFNLILFMWINAKLYYILSEKSLAIVIMGFPIGDLFNIRSFLLAGVKHVGYLKMM